MCTSRRMISNREQNVLLTQFSTRTTHPADVKAGKFGSVVKCEKQVQNLGKLTSMAMD